MASDMAPGGTGANCSDMAVGGKRRRPQLTSKQVELLHIIGWVLGVADVLLVGGTFIFS